MAVNGPSHVAIIALVLTLCALGSAAEPLSIRPSQKWDGMDGPWSSFRIEVGTPPQQVRVLPAHDQSSSWFILGEACSDEDDGCAEERGMLYNRSSSSSWDEFGFYELNPWLEKRVGQDGSGLYGWDDINLGWTGDNMPTMKNQSIAGITTPNFYLASLSLNPRPVNFTDYNDPIPSLMQNLKNKTDTPIPSLSWSYTAGAYNLAPKVFGSLVLGGYDTTRFTPNSVTFPFGEDISLDFQVAIQSITTSLTDDSLLDTGIIAYISTLVADIWLPASVCTQFEKAFGLEWDNATELYLLDTSLHQSLLEEDPSVRFTIGPEVTGAAVTIKMPYWNFYQIVAPELTNASSPKMYFPLKRAANDSQYILGRTFLQSAHLSADYERNTFNLSQALFPSSATPENIVPVLSPLQETRPGDGDPGTDGEGSGGSGSSLSTGAIVGIIVGLVVVIGVLATVAFIMFRRRKANPKKHELDDTDIQHTLPHEVSGDQLKVEMGGALSHEVLGDTTPKSELAAYGRQKPVEADGTSSMVYEMPGEIPTPELPAENGHQVPNSHRAPPSITITQEEASITPPSEHRSYQDSYRHG